MRQRPYGHELLETARLLLREELLHTLPEEKKLLALMIANTMGIAARQLAAGDAPAHNEWISLTRILGKDIASSLPSDNLIEHLSSLNRELCASIREGKTDPDGVLRMPVGDHLREVARQKLLESNPKYLDANV